MDPRINFAAFLPLLVGGMSWCVGVRGQQPQKMESSLSLAWGNFLTATLDGFYDFTHHLVSISMDSSEP